MVTSCLLLKVRDEAVALLQNILIILCKYYEDRMRSSHSTDSYLSPNLEIIQLTYDTVAAIMASLWPCEQQFVAVFGPTGCGKSTILNVILSMMCSTGELYEHGISVDSGRAVLRETAKTLGGYGMKPDNGVDFSEDNVDTGDPEDSEESAYKYLNVGNGAIDISAEKDSVAGLLGICCAKNKEKYLSEHLPVYDARPFLLQNGRMGDAGTIKVTAIEYGPQFAGYIRWVSKKKLRKQFRELRKLLESDNCEEQEKAELQEIWQCILRFVEESPDSYPDEECINRVLSALKNKVQLGTEEVIRTKKSRGSTIDRIVVRDSIIRKLQYQKGQLAEDVRIEVPVASFEGGISLLDVPGTNDPRVLHQCETRDAIDRTSLILLILDKSVMDEQTRKVLEESPVLEKMLMDEHEGCSLTVVGVAEKGIRKGQPPKELISGFDPRNDLRKNLEKIFYSIARRLINSRRISKDDVRQRVNILFHQSNRISVLPVLPLLCASIHLSPPNSALHNIYCESQGESSCPLKMTEAEKMRRCLETNMPQLIESIHSVRMAPKRDEIYKSLIDVEELLLSLTEQPQMNSSFVEFLRQEAYHARSIKAKKLCLDADVPFLSVSEKHIHDMLTTWKRECILTSDEIEFVKTVLDSKAKVKQIASQLHSGGFLMGPLLLRGFRPEVIGKRAQELIKPVDDSSREFIRKAFEILQNARSGGAARQDAIFENMELDPGRCINLYEQTEKRWKLSLERLRAKCYCGGIDGGLLGKIRLVMRKAYDDSIKHFFEKLKQQSTESSLMDFITRWLCENKAAEEAVKSALENIQVAIYEFGTMLLKQTSREIHVLWTTWQKQISKLESEASKALILASEGSQPTEIKGGDTVFQENLNEKKSELRKLLHRLSMMTIETEKTEFHYGYSLLHSDPAFNLCRSDDSIPHSSSLAGFDSGKEQVVLPIEVSNVNTCCNSFEEPVKLLPPKLRNKHDENPSGCQTGSKDDAKDNSSKEDATLLATSVRNKQDDNSSRSSKLKIFYPNKIFLEDDVTLKQEPESQDVNQYSTKHGTTQFSEQISPRSKLSSASKIPRRAVLLSEAESRQLQARETSPRKKTKF